MANTILNKLVVVKRSGQRVDFNKTKILVAMKKSFDSVSTNYSEIEINKCLNDVINYIENEYSDRKTISIEEIQNIIEKTLYKNEYISVYEAFNTYRKKRSISRETFEEKEQHKLLKSIEKITKEIENNSLNNKELISDIGKMFIKEYAKSYLLDTKYLRLQNDGYIYIPSLETYKLGFIEDVSISVNPNEYENIREYLEYTYIYANKTKNEIYKKLSLSNLDKNIFEIFIIELKTELQEKIPALLKKQGLENYINLDKIKDIIQSIKDIDYESTELGDYFKNKELDTIIKNEFEKTIKNLTKKLEIEFKYFLLKINKIDNQNNIPIEIYLNNSIPLNIMYEEIKENKYKNLIFILDSKYETNTNKIIYKTVLENKIINSSISLNLARLAIESKDKKEFIETFENYIDIVKNIMLTRFEIQGKKTKEEYEVLFNNNLIESSLYLEENQKVRKIIKNGSFKIKLIGLTTSSIIQKMDILVILKEINEKLKQINEDTKLNFIVVEEDNQEVIKYMYGLDKSLYAETKLKTIEEYTTIESYLVNEDIKKEKLEQINKLYSYHIKTKEKSTDYISYEINYD